MRPAYRPLRIRGSDQGRRGLPGTRNPVVLGRKFCAGCGRWRQVCDFDVRAAGLAARCQACRRIAQREAYRRWTAAQRANKREYARIYGIGRRRAAGMAPRHWRQPRPSVVDHVEPLYLDAAPLQAEIRRVGELEILALRAGVHERSVLRLRDSSQHVRFDLADRLAIALGTSLYALYGDAELQRFAPSAWRAAA